ncbi:MAG TPA: glutamate--tRNA ligase [Fibrobacteria bacterium]|nr:glutamate--tRNA ligase [Fibrobacteria bacterium]
MSSETPSRVRVRFAPSPTGYLHVGGARTAIFNWLFARRMGGDFLLRIEDTDQARYDEKALHDLIHDLKWLGLNWDEGPEVGGPHAPYFQSQRLPLYKEHAHKLLAGGHAYPCFCTAERLDELRETQKRNNLPTSYDRHCRNIPAADAKARLDSGEKHTIRLKVPFHGSTRFEDFLRGPIEYQNRILDDMVLLKSDGFPTYHLANVVDDHDMKISHVLRGDEWIPSTPRHVILYNAFGWTPPVFVHLPVILSPDGGKLSKRKGAASVGDYRDLGYLPETMVNFLSLLGWNPGDDQEFMERDVLVSRFSIEKINPKSAAFDEKKLEWLNGQYFLKRDVDFFLPLVKPLWEKAGVDLSAFGDAYLRAAVGLLKDRSKRMGDFVAYGMYFFKDPDTFDEKTAKKHFGPGSDALLEGLLAAIEGAPTFDTSSLETAYKARAEATGVKYGDLIHPTRLAISGIPFGPGLFELMAALGKETVVRRMRYALGAIRGGTLKTAVLA